MLINLRNATIKCVYNIEELDKLGQLPPFIDPKSIFKNKSLCETVEYMLSTEVVWHKSCRNAVDNQKVSRAQQKVKEDTSCIKTRRLNNGTKCVTMTSNPPSHTSDIPEKPCPEPCIFCNVVGDPHELRKCSTLELDKKVNECATIIGDENLLAKLAGTDIIAIDAYYHRSCLTKLYRKAENILKNQPEDEEQIIKEQVLIELIDFIEEARSTGKVIMLSTLTSLFDTRISGLGYPHVKCHGTRLRQDIQDKISDVTFVKDKKATVLCSMMIL